MLTPLRKLVAPTGALLAVLAFSQGALASPITVNLRVEGSAKTLFEGQVTTDGGTLTTTSGGAHSCDYKDNGSSGGYANGGNSAGTPTTALHDAAVAQGLTFDALWFGTGASNGDPGDFFVSQVGADVNQSTAPYASWGFAVNSTTAPVGGCQIALAPGNSVLWAYDYFNKTHLLALSGAATAISGVAFTVHVVDGQTGAALSGAAVGEVLNGVTTTSASTDASGDATITLTQTGTHTLKATRADSVRSNGLTVCVHDTNDGGCATTASNPGASVPSIFVSSSSSSSAIVQIGATADVPRIADLHNGNTFTAHRAPRILRGAVTLPAGATLREVRIRLERRHNGRCSAFNGRKGAFVSAKCGGAKFFSVGSSASFSFLLPARLPAGRYVYEIQALDQAGSPTKLTTGVSHVVFRVK
ncbi:MAG TPA: hypothetical protein VLJ42_00225 [Solirubrobacteraceae bacterium]|nr:hypothetical protein [Solirubrobacteraceae bacterium]